MNIKNKLQRLSPYLWFKYSKTIEFLNRNAMLKEFMSKHKDIKSMHTKFEYYSFINNEIISNEPITYLEFGVYKGKSITTWAKLNKNDSSVFYGFDTFTGLPEDWNSDFKKGAFSLEGDIPKLDDPRIHLIKGFFQETLRPFLQTFERDKRLIIHLDADLYSSTMFCLSALDNILKSGDILMFDEFSHPTDEFKAFIDWCSAYNRKPEMILNIGEGWLSDLCAFQI